MKEATIEKTNPVEEVKEEVIEQETIEKEPEKGYTFRKLASPDMFLMTKILGKIGIREFKGAFNGDSVEELVKIFKEQQTDKAIMHIGVQIGLEGVDIIFGNLYKCENDIYTLLSNVSDVSVDEIKADALLFTEMLIDFFKKPEFPDFIKVVSRLFK